MSKHSIAFYTQIYYVYVIAINFVMSRFSYNKSLISYKLDTKTLMIHKPIPYLNISDFQFLSFQDDGNKSIKLNSSRIHLKKHIGYTFSPPINKAKPSRKRHYVLSDELLKMGQTLTKNKGFLQLTRNEKVRFNEQPQSATSPLISKTVYLPGDIMIGALFPIHYQPKLGSSRQCGDIWEQYGIQRLEAALRTLESINADSLILPGISLGLEIRDSCWYSSIALGQTIEFIRDHISMHSPETMQASSKGLSNLVTVAWSKIKKMSRNKQSNQTTNDDSIPFSTDLSLRAAFDGKERFALVTKKQSLNSVLSAKRRGKSKKKEDIMAQNKNIAAIIGPGSSTVAIQVQNLLQLFDIPQIDYATSKDLSNKKLYKTYMRVVPSDQYQAQVMIDIVKHNGWTYIAAINTEGSYGGSGMAAFKTMAKSQDICISMEDSIYNNAEQSDYDNILKNIMSVPRINVIICFCEGFTVRGLLISTRRLGVVGKYVFIGSDGWADRDDVIKDYEMEAVGGLSIRINSPYVADFDDYYFALKPETNLRNVWFRELWEFKFNCSLTNPEAKCLQNLSLRQNYKQDTKLAFVINSVNTIAHGLHDMHLSECKGVKGFLCPAMKPMNGTLLMQYLLNVSFEGVGGESVNFDENGDPPAKYDIVNFQMLGPNSFGYKQIGGWYEKNLDLNFSLYQQPVKQNGTVISICSEQCQFNFIKSIKKGGLPCCWECRECKPNEYILDEFTCRTCELGYWPNSNKTSCFKITERYVQWNDIASLVAMGMASVGCIIACLFLTVFLRHHNTPVVKSSTRELMYLILLGIIISFLTSVPMSIKPDNITCALNRTLPGFSFSLVYSALATKTNRISRILEGTRKKERIRTKKPKFMSLRAQLIITAFLVSMEVVIVTTMLILEQPSTKLHYPQMLGETGRRVEIVCATSNLAILAPLSYNFFLISLCTAYAIKTRNLPENFNEAKFIGFGMYTTCVIWIAFVPVYFGSESKAVSYCFCVIISAYVALIFLFVPKIYIIIFKPEKNNRSAFVTSKTLRYHFGKTTTGVGSATSIKSEEEPFGLYDGIMKSPNIPVLLSTQPLSSEISITPQNLLKTSFSSTIESCTPRKGAINKSTMLRLSNEKRSFVLKFGKSLVRRHTLMPSTSTIRPKDQHRLVQAMTSKKLSIKTKNRLLKFDKLKLRNRPFSHVPSGIPVIKKIKRPCALDIYNQRNMFRISGCKRSPLYATKNSNLLPIYNLNSEHSHVTVNNDLFHIIRTIYLNDRPLSPWLEETKGEDQRSIKSPNQNYWANPTPITTVDLSIVHRSREINLIKDLNVKDRSFRRNFDFEYFQTLKSPQKFEHYPSINQNDVLCENDNEQLRVTHFLESMLRFDSKHNKSCQTDFFSSWMKSTSPFDEATRTRINNFMRGPCENATQSLYLTTPDSTCTSTWIYNMNEIYSPVNNDIISCQNYSNSNPFDNMRLKDNLNTQYSKKVSQQMPIGENVVNIKIENMSAYCTTRV